MSELSFVSDMHPNNSLVVLTNVVNSTAGSKIPIDTLIGPFPSYIWYAIIYGCGSLYLIPSLMSWSRVWRNRHSDMTAVKLFSLIGFGSAIRAVAFLLVTIWMIKLVQAKDTPEVAIHLHLSYKQLVVVWEILSILGSLLMAGVFLLVFITWAGMIDHVTTSSCVVGQNFNENATATVTATFTTTTAAGWFRELFVKINIFLYLFQGISFLAFSFMEKNYFSQWLYLLGTISIGLVSCICIFLLPAYSTRMCILLEKIGENTTENRRRKRNIRRIALISCVFFCLRFFSEFFWGFALYSSLLVEEKVNYHHPPDHHQQQQQQQQSSSSSFSSFFFLLRDKNPIFFLNGKDEQGQHWLVFLQVVEFPVEWGMFMALLYVLPSHTVLPTMRGYTPIPERTRVY
jgi:hypothetical protein